MERFIYEEIAQIEGSHWWFAGRRAISRHILKRLELPKQAAILDAGCGAGGNLSMLSAFGDVHAFEYDEATRAIAVNKHIGTVEAGKLPDGIPFADKTFDVITMFDVLEHIEDDAAALQALFLRLNKGGHMLITVPAMPWMWSQHDVDHHHFRRYSKAGLEKQLNEAGFAITLLNYFNTFMFPAAAILRLLEKKNTATHKPSSSLHFPEPFNGLVKTVFAAERFVIPHIPMPFGVSLIAVVTTDT